jgi:hypothetical protein
MKLSRSKEMYAILEVASGITLILMSAFIVWQETQSPGNSPPVFWGVIMAIFGAFQLLSLYYKNDMVPLRIIIAWVAGTTYLWIAYLNLYSILVVPMITMGAANFISFIDMCDRASFSKHIEFINKEL